MAFLFLLTIGFVYEFGKGKYVALLELIAGTGYDLICSRKNVPFFPFNDY
jgi:hypothetical protein